MTTSKHADTAVSRRRDGQAERYSYEPEAPHYIEHAAVVYLRLSDEGTHWIVDAASVDGHALDPQSDGDASNSECACGRADECETVRARADKLSLPTGEELAELIRDALPK